MSQRKKTPDILGDLLGNKPASLEPIAETARQRNALTAKQQNVVPSSQQDSLTVKPQDILPASQQKVLTVKQQNALPVKPQDVLPVRQQRVNAVITPKDNVDLAEEEVEAKTKMTFYLSEDSVERLEEAQRSLRRMAKRLGKVHPKGITSKSALLEEALKLACNDLEENGPQSRFASLIL